jgi:hypothetical protein
MFVVDMSRGIRRRSIADTDEALSTDILQLIGPDQSPSRSLLSSNANGIFELQAMSIYKAPRIHGMPSDMENNGLSVCRALPDHISLAHI